MKVPFLFLGLIASAYLFLRIDIFMSLPIVKASWLFYMSLGFINSVLIYLIARKYFGIAGALVSVLAYVSSPLIAYYEFSSSIYLPALSCLLLMTYLFLTKRIYLFLALSALLVLVLINTSGVTLFSDPGIVNGLNQLRGESTKSGFGLESKIIENKYSYLSLHFLFNYLKQFSPAVYFSPEYKILGFSCSPPILFGFLIVTLIGLISLVKNIRVFLLAILIFSFLTLPSVLSKNSPDLERLIIVVPAVSLLCGYGFSKIPKLFKILILILIIFQFTVILFDISLREPIRFLMLK